jgi:tRNA synthetases class I (C) catalytic domain
MILRCCLVSTHALMTMQCGTHRVLHMQRNDYQITSYRCMLTYCMLPLQVMNITDIDDKIIARANQRGLEFRELASHFEADYMEDMKSLGILPPEHITRVSEFIPEVVAYIQQIMDNGYAYESNGSIYFTVEAYHNKQYTSKTDTTTTTDGVDSSNSNSTCDGNDTSDSTATAAVGNGSMPHLCQHHYGKLLPEVSNILLNSTSLIYIYEAHRL